MAMTATVFYCDENAASNGGHCQLGLCVDGKVHLQNITSWYDQTGDEQNSFHSEYWGKLAPCNGSCQNIIKTLPSEVEELVRRFLETNGKEVGEISKSTPIYSAEDLAKFESGMDYEPSDED